MKSYYIIFVMAALIMGACEKTEFQTAGDFVHLSNKGTSMPIWVKGNFQSDVIIITVHGGPGDSGMEQHISKGFKQFNRSGILCQFINKGFINLHFVELKIPKIAHRRIASAKIINGQTYPHTSNLFCHTSNVAYVINKKVFCNFINNLRCRYLVLS